VFYKGTNWFSFNRKTVGDVLEFVTNNNWYLNVFEQSLCGDEVFFHTLLKFIGVDDIFHDPEKVNDVLRYIDWSTGPDYPRILNGTDLYRIKKSGCIFARKFTQPVD
ncbi:beta-1,6-N-acetylglucosaminyltransferase, partial [Klebsiella variicola]|uniref:beta-1,6-N-acetylglucosaminyltransferase n=1 Tax=Klebsiella variicola TaxID=244366 RepID=UPI001D1002BD